MNRERVERIAELRAAVRGCTSKDCRWWGPCASKTREADKLERQEREGLDETDLADVCFG